MLSPGIVWARCAVQIVDLVTATCTHIASRLLCSTNAQPLSYLIGRNHITNHECEMHIKSIALLAVIQRCPEFLTGHVWDHSIVLIVDLATTTYTPIVFQALGSTNRWPSSYWISWNHFTNCDYKMHYQEHCIACTVIQCCPMLSTGHVWARCAVWIINLPTEFCAPIASQEMSSTSARPSSDQIGWNRLCDTDCNWKTHIGSIGLLAQLSNMLNWSRWRSLFCLNHRLATATCAHIASQGLSSTSAWPLSDQIGWNHSWRWSRSHNTRLEHCIVYTVVQYCPMFSNVVDWSLAGSLCCSHRWSGKCNVYSCCFPGDQ